MCLSRLIEELKQQNPEFPDVSSGIYVHEVVPHSPAHKLVIFIHSSNKTSRQFVSCFWSKMNALLNSRSSSLSLSPEVVSKMVTLLWNLTAHLWWPRPTCRGHCRKRRHCCWKSGGTTMTFSLTSNLTLSCSRHLKHSSISELDQHPRPYFCERTRQIVKALPAQWNCFKAHTSSDTLTVPK